MSTVGLIGEEPSEEEIVNDAFIFQENIENHIKGEHSIPINIIYNNIFEKYGQKVPLRIASIVFCGCTLSGCPSRFCPTCF